jgi:MinD-like ATPase involved in chromosome partitioning or flagellar assembly
MHTTTFYSFKGGVGRTLALVNVGVELAMTGRKVLLVDFDLEAPGIDSFEELKAPENQAGVVDFVTDFLNSGTPPHFGGYHYRASLPVKDGGALWVMPAGRRDSQYASKLAAIDWQYLYGEMQGFLLLEDLKAQWAEQLAPDYVLIDSRTGHSEIGGICTRQLPDTVAVLFIPNGQNLSGLVDVVRAIRSESKRSNRRTINLEFVASNVPHMDDEEEILKSMMKTFAHTLDFTKAVTIERYDSLQLLNQSVFVLRRPRSRLSKQYRTLLQKIVANNFDDRQAALSVIRHQFTRRGGRYGPIASDEKRTEADNRIKEILGRHAEDSEILFASGTFFRVRGDVKAAATLFEKAAHIATEQDDVAAGKYLLAFVESRAASGQNDDLRADLVRCLQSENLGLDGVSRVISVAQQAATEPLTELPRSAAVRNIPADGLAYVASHLHVSREWQQIGLELLLCNSSNLPSESQPDSWKNELMMTSIALGRFSEAIALIDMTQITQSEADVALCFNLAMATWGASRRRPVDLFSRVVDLDSKRASDLPSNPNYEECLALAEFIVGNGEKAKRRLEESRRLIREIPFRQFSCWSYLLREPRDFLHDLEQMERLFSGEDIMPVIVPVQRSAS